LHGDFIVLPEVVLVVKVGISIPTIAFRDVVAVVPAVVAFKPIPRLSSSASDWRYSAYCSMEIAPGWMSTPSSCLTEATR
jgi:hypothetical protein